MINKKLKFLEGALIGAVLGVAAGIILAPESGKELRKDLKKKSADFYRHLGPKMKKLKKISEEDYKMMVQKTMAFYGKAKKLSQSEAKQITKEAENYWKHLRKHA